jgi:sigma-B regulation protein RsbQ
MCMTAIISAGLPQDDIDGLLDFQDSNYLGWSSTMAPVIMGNPERPELRQELENSFCQTHPDIAKHFARVTFLSDNRADLSKVTIPCLILQCSSDSTHSAALVRVQLRAKEGCERRRSPHSDDRVRCHASSQLRTRVAAGK